MILKSYMRETLIGSTKFYQLYFHYGIVKIKEKNSINTYYSTFDENETTCCISIRQ